jgi:membrane-associated phospholipid phosphatase
MVLAALLVHPWDKTLSDTLRFSPHLHDNRLLRSGIDWIRIFGKGDVLVLLALAVGGWGCRRRGTAILVALVISTMLVWPLKMTVGRERPRGQSHVSFPSGDAAAIAAAVVPLAAGAPLFMPAVGGVVAGVAFGRVFQGAHYPSDVLAGIAVGLVAGGLALLVCRRLSPAGLRERHFLFLMAVYLAGSLAVLPRHHPNAELVRALWLLVPALSARVIVGRLNGSRPTATPDRHGPKTTGIAGCESAACVLFIAAALLVHGNLGG